MLFAGGLYLVYLVRDVVVLLFISLFLAVALGPAVDFFHRRKFPRPLSILIVYLLGVLAVVPGRPARRAADRRPGATDVAKKAPQYIKDIRNNPTLREYDDKYKITAEARAAGQQAAVRLGSAAGTLQSVTVGVFSAARQARSRSCRSRSSCCSTGRD